MANADRHSPAGGLEPGLRVVRAPNPSPMTHTGTNSWIVGEGVVALIDPGPDLPAHRDALMAALAPGERIGHIFVTHAHLDHSPLARPLGDATGAPVWAAGSYAERRRPVMARLAASGLVGGGEGVDAGFRPDRVLEDGDHVAEGGWRLTAIATPGHIADHLSFAWDVPGADARAPAIFTGDHVMGWASSLVSPPDGDLTTFLESCARLRGLGPRIFYPGHGAPVTDPEARLDWLVAHRESRDAEIRQALRDLPGRTPRALAEAVYTDIDPALLGAAERNVLAHLIAAWEAGDVTAAPALAADARFALV